MGKKYIITAGVNGAGKMLPNRIWEKGEIIQSSPDNWIIRDYMDIEERLKTVPRSYDDFVRYVKESMAEDEDVKAFMEDYLETHPESNSGEVLLALFDFVGIGEPMEIVDDDDEPETKLTSSKKRKIVAAL